MDMVENNLFCCGCCLGLAVGYMLWGGNNDCPKQSQVNPPSPFLSLTNIVVQETTKRTGPAGFLLHGIDHYQREISPQLKEKLGRERLCKYEPSCSEYAKQAIENHGSVAGMVMTTMRLTRCNPWSKGGEDSVGTPWYAKKIC